MPSMPSDVVLLQMGGPSSLDELRPFYTRLFADAEMIRLPAALRPLQPALAGPAARVRARMLRGRYEQIGGGSPLVRHTSALAGSLADELARRGTPARIHVAMRYSEPSADRVMADLKAGNAREALLLPLYPHWSHATTGSSVSDVLRAARCVGFQGTISWIRAWGDDAGYIDLLAQCIEATRASLAAEWAGPIHLLFSAHGLPVRYVAAGDPYPEEVATTAELVAARVRGFASWRLSYQSRMGPVRWLEPSTDTMLRRLALDGARALVVVPLGFVSDHIETLYDLDILYRQEAHELGIRDYRRVPSFNADPAFATVLADILASRPAERG